MHKAKKGILTLLLVTALAGILAGQSAIAQSTDLSEKQNTMPLMWLSQAAPDYFWEEMEKIVAQGYVPDMIEDWRATYGQDRDDWPLEYQAIDCLWGEKNDPDLVDTVLRGLPSKDDITTDAAIDIVWQKFLEENNGIVGQEVIDHLRPRVTFFYNFYIDDNHTYQIVLVTDKGDGYACFDIDAKTGVVERYGIGPGQG